MDKDVTIALLPETAEDADRRYRLVRLLAAGVERLLAGRDITETVKNSVDLSPDLRVTTTTARPGGGDES